MKTEKQIKNEMYRRIKVIESKLRFKLEDMSIEQIRSDIEWCYKIDDEN